MIDLEEIEARIRDCKTYNFGLWNADKLAHEDAPAMLDELRHLRMIASANQGAIVNSIIERTQGEPSAAQVSVEEFRAHIGAERLRQAGCGYDSAHDRRHGIDHLLAWAQDYARRGKVIASAALVEAARELLARREPSKDEVDAAIAAYKESARMHPGRAHMRAALRAAGEVADG